MQLRKDRMGGEWVTESCRRLAVNVDFKPSNSATRKSAAGRTQTSGAQERPQRLRP
jgi:hypothetical protein